MKLITLMMCLLSLSSVFAGEMKKIDLVTRETVANVYYTGFDQDEYYDFMYSEIWNMQLTEGSEDCLVITRGMTTETILEERSEVEFAVCINKLENGEYTGYLIYN
jgi:hypothetical protein